MSLKRSKRRTAKAKFPLGFVLRDMSSKCLQNVLKIMNKTIISVDIRFVQGVSKTS